MEIVINALPYKQNSSGIGNLIRELFGRYVAVSSRQCKVILTQDAPVFPGEPHGKMVRIPCKYQNSIRRILFQIVGLGCYFCRNAVLLTTDSKIPFFLPHSCTAVTLVTDLAVYRMPEVYQLSRVILWRVQYWYIKRRANFFLAISEFTKREMVEILNIPPERIQVVYCACSPSMVRVNASEKNDKYRLPTKFLLFVGSHNPRKNLERVLQAFDKAKDDIPHHLVIAGDSGWKFDQEAATQGLKHKAEVHFIGFVPDEDMPWLYSAADLFLFPTLYEGFGIPVIEAQRCGTPVLTSNCSALPETAGKGAYYVNPYDINSISDGIKKILRDHELSASLVREGYRNAERFSWEASAARLDKIIEENIL